MRFQPQRQQCFDEVARGFRPVLEEQRSHHLAEWRAEQQLVACLLEYTIAIRDALKKKADDPHWKGPFNAEEEWCFANLRVGVLTHMHELVQGKVARLEAGDNDTALHWNEEWRRAFDEQNPDSTVHGYAADTVQAPLPADRYTDIHGTSPRVA